MRTCLKMLFAGLALGLAGSVQAAVVKYDGTGGYSNLDVTYTTTNSTGNVALDPAHYFIPNTTNAMYYGGTVTFNRSGGEWSGNNFQFLIGNAADPWTFSPAHGSDSALLMAQDGQANWLFGGSNPSVWAGVGNTGISANTPGSFDFVIKISKYSPWNESTYSIFLGTKATAATEGTPDVVAQINGSTKTINFMSWSLKVNGGTPSLTTANMFSSDTWAPVSIPEPTSASLVIGGMALLGLRRRRA